MEKSKREPGKGKKRVDAAECIHCHVCRKNCDFLSKYKIDIGDRKQLEELAYHCFLCGKCTEVCPIGIDGREEILSIRRKKSKDSQGKPGEKGYRMLLAEKKNYLFRNYRNAAGKSVLFPGCNFPSFYPKTTEKLVRLLREKTGMGVVYDCCGKPVAELGMKDQEEKIIRGIEARLEKHGIIELVTMCPNCYYFLKPRLSVRVTGIYEKLRELELGSQIPGGDSIFTPCPDRETYEWLEDIRTFLAQECRPIQGVQCCGLGGCAGVKEVELSKKMTGKLAEEMAERRKEGLDVLYTYCASCAGNLARNGCENVQHVLSEILDVHEKPDTGRSMLNRMRTKLL